MLGINIMIGMFWPCQDFGWMFKCFLSLTICSKNFKSSPSKIRVFSFCWVLTETSLSRADKNDDDEGDDCDDDNDADNDDDDVEGEKHDILVVSRTRGWNSSKHVMTSKTLWCKFDLRQWRRRGWRRRRQRRRRRQWQTNAISRFVSMGVEEGQGKGSLKGVQGY